jgi:ribosomal protein S18 acetylase RimI-like enzyme
MFMSRAVEISVGSVGDIPQLREAFLSLHDHHRRLSAVVLTKTDERAWAARVSTYEQYFAEGHALLHLARIDGRCVGYALTVLHPGTDDIFPLSPEYAELYTLAVLPDSRGSGIGSALLDAVDTALSNRAIANLTVAVMCANEAAIRLYRRRGFIAGELILYRIGGEPSNVVTEQRGTN